MSAGFRPTARSRNMPRTSGTCRCAQPGEDAMSGGVAGRPGTSSPPSSRPGTATPSRVLGPHDAGRRASVDPGLRARCRQSSAVGARRRDRLAQLAGAMHPDGFFEGFVHRPYAAAFAYRLQPRNAGGAWRFRRSLRLRAGARPDWTTISCVEGTHRRLYERLGAHLIEHEGVAGVHFAVWAPQCAACLRGRRFQCLGRPPAPDAQARRQRPLGNLRPLRSARAPSTNTSSSARTERCCR